MKTSTFLRAFGISRLALGLWLSVTPQKPGELWFGSTQHSASTSALLRSVGARDIGLGLGLASDPKPTSAWLRAGVVADAGDVVAALLIRDRVPVKNFLTGVFGARAYAVIGGFVAIRSAR